MHVRRAVLEVRGCCYVVKTSGFRGGSRGSGVFRSFLNPVGSKWQSQGYPFLYGHRIGLDRISIVVRGAGRGENERVQMRECRRSLPWAASSELGQDAGLLGPSSFFEQAAGGHLQ